MDSAAKGKPLRVRGSALTGSAGGQLLFGMGFLSVQIAVIDCLCPGDLLDARGLDLSFRFARQLLENESVAHIAKVEHEGLGQVGVEVDRYPRPAVRVVAR